ncbi:uncharacterized protein NFIA_100420 [Aspergillus fischeri NRRL 181]|uniref:Uncharacterized protein n=1 Tax=Neosartorya fischeri (strain ATCC 1020 / DSM 3700 / CBS 544.65 / FGSC A1164 / JCM 1740 / NRRL 181 / WB 181) TaxID=331117 RepID=A1DC15_NEOFI|nr:uncharacterized protein NFIA_100420 [Aspergillus fischeri NRRL 181]EAW20405.1 hypothetical protein NFIA_100420 [Aspergillus fischeri NRRL 181]
MVGGVSANFGYIGTPGLLIWQNGSFLQGLDVQAFLEARIFSKADKPRRILLNSDVPGGNAHMVLEVSTQSL